MYFPILCFTDDFSYLAYHCHVLLLQGGRKNKTVCGPCALSTFKVMAVRLTHLPKWELILCNWCWHHCPDPHPTVVSSKCLQLSPVPLKSLVMTASSSFSLLSLLCIYYSWSWRPSAISFSPAWSATWTQGHRIKTAHPVWTRNQHPIPFARFHWHSESQAKVRYRVGNRHHFLMGIYEIPPRIKMQESTPAIRPNSLLLEQSNSSGNLFHNQKTNRL